MEESIGLLRDAFLQRLEKNSFRDLPIEGPITSVCQFIDLLTAGNLTMRQFGFHGQARFRDLTDLRMTFGEFLQLTVRMGNGTIPLSTMLVSDFCAPVARALVTVLARGMSSDKCHITALREVGAKDWQEWGNAMSHPERIHHLAHVLLDAAAQAFKDKPLLSFFVAEPVVGEFALWGPNASSGHGRKLPTRVIKGDGYEVTVSVSKYEEQDGPVTAYEWEAKLTLVGATEPDAAACGMAYVFDREDGRPVGQLTDLIIAANSMADDDVLQAHAFTKQHNDANQIIENSDLAFVWLWERRSGAEKGLGAKCLSAGLDDLRRRFKKLRTVMFNVSPGQFVWESPIDPPMVAVERQTAVENLVSYIHGLGLKFDVRPIFIRSLNARLEALTAVRQAFVDSEMDDDGEDARDGEGIDIDEWQDEIVDLLSHAGLHELAGDVEDDIATIEEIETALRYLIFDQRVNYLRVSVSGSFISGLDMAQSADGYESSRDYQTFVDELPEGMVVEDVLWDEGCLICKVRADTPFGILTEHFTMIRKPRPINIGSYFRDIEE